MVKMEGSGQPVMTFKCDLLSALWNRRAYPCCPPARAFYFRLLHHLNLDSGLGLGGVPCSQCREPRPFRTPKFGTVGCVCPPASLCPPASWECPIPAVDA